MYEGLPDSSLHLFQFPGNGIIILSAMLPNMVKGIGKLGSCDFNFRLENKRYLLKE